VHREGGVRLAGADRRADSGHPARQPRENGYKENFNGKRRDELLDREIFHSLKKVEVLIER
jgi:Integrase core domain